MDVLLPSKRMMSLSLFWYCSPCHRRPVRSITHGISSPVANKTLPNREELTVSGLPDTGLDRYSKDRAVESGYLGRRKTLNATPTGQKLLRIAQSPSADRMFDFPSVASNVME